MERFMRVVSVLLFVISITFISVFMFVLATDVVGRITAIVFYYGFLYAFFVYKEKPSDLFEGARKQRIAIEKDQKNYWDLVEMHNKGTLPKRGTEEWDEFYNKCIDSDVECLLCFPGSHLSLALVFKKMTE